jgi:flagellar hook protein FlgE
MNALASTALSGLSAAQSDLQSRAHNLANLGTDGFRRSLPQRSSVDGGGVAASVTRAARPGHALADDMVGQLQARNAFMANLAVFRTGDAMTGTLLDTLA